jgi:hypothetical protein
MSTSLIIIRQQLTRFQILSRYFLIFSDDPVWRKTKKHLFESQFYFACDLAEYTSISLRDMALMSCRDHHIIANSTFSWRAAWLKTRRARESSCPGSGSNIIQQTFVASPSHNGPRCTRRSKNPSLPLPLC